MWFGAPGESEVAGFFYFVRPVTLDNSGLPQVRRYPVPDAAKPAYRHYPAASDQLNIPIADHHR